MRRLCVFEIGTCIWPAGSPISHSVRTPVRRLSRPRCSAQAAPALACSCTAPGALSGRLAGCPYNACRCARLPLTRSAGGPTSTQPLSDRVLPPLSSVTLSGLPRQPAGDASGSLKRKMPAFNGGLAASAQPAARGWSGGRRPRGRPGSAGRAASARAAIKMKQSPRRYPVRAAVSLQVAHLGSPVPPLSTYVRTD